MGIERAIALATRRAYTTLDQPIKRSHTRPRGVALIIALVTIALLSSAVVEYMYSSRVNLAMASNERDRLKSYFMARSGMNLSLLLLNFQYALQRESRGTDDDMGQLISRAMRRSNFQIYQYIDLLMQPFHSGKIETPVGGIDLEDSGVEGFGNFTGEFTADVRPEAGRIDLNAFFKTKLEAADLSPLCAMLIDPRYDEMFQRKDETGQVMDRARTIQNIVDFIDPNNEGFTLNDQCEVQGGGSDEGAQYARDDRKIRPRDAKLTHPEDIFQVQGLGQEFMDTFGDKFTVYNVGKPNINVADAAMFYSILCQAVKLQVGGQDVSGFALCAQSPLVASQVLYFALALDGVRTFFEDPLSVLVAYVGTEESRLLPSAKKGQPVAFLSVSQLPNYIRDFEQNPLLMAQFIQYSPTYQVLALTNPAMQLDPIAPQFPAWTIGFDKTRLTKSVTTTAPQVFRITATGSYGTTETTIEAVVDVSKTARRMPDEEDLEEQDDDPEALKEAKQALRDEREAMPKGRVLYWREY